MTILYMYMDTSTVRVLSLEIEQNMDQEPKTISSLLTTISSSVRLPPPTQVYQASTLACICGPPYR